MPTYGLIAGTIDPRPPSTRATARLPKTRATVSVTRSGRRRYWRSVTRKTATYATSRVPDRTPWRVIGGARSDRDRGAQRAHRRRAQVVAHGLDVELDGDQERIDEHRVELPAPLAPHLRDRLFRAPRRAVRPGVDDGIEGVDDPDDPGAERDRIAAQAVGVAAAIPALVVVADDRPERRAPGEGQADPLADDRVAPHLGPLPVGQRAGLGQDRVADPDLADVMEHRPEHDGPELERIDRHVLAEAMGEAREALAVVLG